MMRPTNARTTLAWLTAIALIGVTVLAWAQAPVRHEVQGTAGGTVRATQWGVTPTGPCMGWIPRQSHVRFTVPENGTVTIRVRSHTDTTLIVRGGPADAPVSFCNDDHEGTNPGLHQAMPAGEYRAFVGTWDAGDRVPFTMTVEVQAP